jgi:hypothetical protein
MYVTKEGQITALDAPHNASHELLSVWAFLSAFVFSHSI